MIIESCKFGELLKQSYYRWEKKYANMPVLDLKQLQERHKKYFALVEDHTLYEKNEVEKSG